LVASDAWPHAISANGSHRRSHRATMAGLPQESMRAPCMMVEG